MNDESSTQENESKPVEDATPANQIGAEPQPEAPGPPVTEPDKSIAEQPNPAQSEEETDRKQDESIAMLADQTTWIAKQTQWMRYQVIATSVLGAITLGVLVYHGVIMRRQSQATMNQTQIMQGQLDAMNSGSNQTQQMIAAMQKQADAASAQAGTSEALAEQNQDLVDATLAQAEAAKRSAEIAQQSFYIGDRPYIMAGHVTLENEKFEAGTMPRISFVIQNNGKTPALSLRTGAIVSVENLPKPDVDKYRRMTSAELMAMEAGEIKNAPYPFMPEGSDVFLAAGEAMGLEARGSELTAQLIEDIRSTKAFLLFWGFSSYKDALGRHHTLKFCFFYAPSEDSFIACQTFNSTS